MSTASFNYTAIFNRLYNTLKTKADHMDMTSYGTNVLLLEDIATELAYEMLYDEYLTRENKWKLARNMSSLVTQSYFHNYAIPRKIGAKGTCRVSISKDFNIATPYEYPTKNIPIPLFTTFSYKDTKYICIEDTLYTTSALFCDVSVMQGIYKSYTYTASGSKFETIPLNNNSIENTVLFIYVNNIQAKPVDSIYDASSDAYCFYIDSLPDMTGIKIKFGDGIFGKQLIAGDIVYIQYVETLGLNGNLYSTNLIDTIDSNIYNVSSELVDLYVTNTSEISGGTDEIDIDKLRDLSPKFYQAGKRAGTSEDYKTIINSFSYIKKANVWGSYETNIDNNRDPWTFISGEENCVYITAANDSGTDLTTSQKTQLVEDIYQKKPPTDILSYMDLKLINLKFYVTAYISDKSKTLNYMNSLIIETLKETYIIDNFEFKQNLYGSDVYSLIDNLSGVRYADIQVLILQSFVFDSTYIGSFTVTMVPINYSVCKVLIKHKDDASYKQIAKVNSNGSITGLNGYDTTGSAVDLAAGTGQFKVNSGLNKPYGEYSLYFEFNVADTENIILTSRAQIINYFDSDVNCLYYTGV